MMKAIIIDDESKSIEILMWELGSFKDDIQILETFTQPEKALEYLKTNKVDAIFLDIEMPTMDGFTFLDRMQDKDVAVVFVTAYSEYALKAIRKEAFDYLLKPINPNHLKEAVERIKKKRQPSLTIDTLEKMLLDINSKNTKKRIPVHTDGYLTFIEANNIIYAEADGSYTRLIIKNEKDILLTKKLKEVEELLQNHSFCRVHNSYVVNLYKIKRFYKTEGYLIMENEKKIPVSRSKRSDFINQL